MDLEIGIETITVFPRLAGLYLLLGKPSQKKYGQTWEKVQTGREGGQLHSTQFPSS